MFIHNWSAETMALVKKMKSREKDRLQAIIAMHIMVCNMNDETAYVKWTYLVPDEASEYDFIDFAMDDEGLETSHLFDEAVTLFKRLWDCYAKKERGIYIGDQCY